MVIASLVRDIAGSTTNVRFTVYRYKCLESIINDTELLFGIGVIKKLNIYQFIADTDCVLRL